MHTKSLATTFANILSTYGITQAEIIYVPNVQDWANTNSLPDNNPERIAMTARRSNSNIWDIILKEDIDENDIPGVTGAMHYRGFKYVDKIADVKTFVLHTFLHEVAHALGHKEELDADYWAYEELYKWQK